MTPENAAKLRAEFPATMIGKLPRVTCKDCSDRNKECQKHKREKCRVCDAFISTAHIHLDFVGHAGVTDRLLSVDPEWTWEPVGFDNVGAPLILEEKSRSVMWIRLSVCGVTRLGVGIVPSGKDEVEKELISDALRNAAMRFGVALDLWSKQDLHDSVQGDEAPSPRVDETRAPDSIVTADPDEVFPVALDDIATMRVPDVVKALIARGITPAGAPDDLRAMLREAVGTGGVVAGASTPVPAGTAA